MGFTLDDIVIDRVQYGFAEDLNGNPLWFPPLKFLYIEINF